MNVTQDDRLRRRLRHQVLQFHAFRGQHRALLRINQLQAAEANKRGVIQLDIGVELGNQIVGGHLPPSVKNYHCAGTEIYTCTPGIQDVLMRAGGIGAASQ